MPSKITGALLISMAAFAIQAQDPIRDYIQRNFPADFVISAAQIQQLQHSIINPTGHTWDMDQRVIEKDVHIELQRAINRLYCLQLLRSGTQQAYQRLVQAQLQDAVANPLTFATFNKLSKHLQRINKQDYQLLQAAVALPAVSHSKLAAKLAHFRHMLYTEGGVGMFRHLRSMIVHGYINSAEIDLWYASWIVNIAGFRGHVNPHGSLYLTEAVAQDMHKLQQLLYTMLDTPNYDPLPPYLEYRAQCLGLQHLPATDRLFLAHLGGIMRLYSPIDGQRLVASVLQLAPSQRIWAQQFFLNGLQDATQYGPTYLPALFGNALALSNGNIELVVAKILPAYNQILQQYSSDGISAVLSFNELSAMQNVARLLQNNTATMQFIFRADGAVLLAS